MRANLLLVFLAAGVVLSGCFSTDSPQTQPDAAIDAARMPSAYHYLCAGASGVPAEAACVTSVPRVGARALEPYAAIDPTNPNVMAVYAMMLPATDDVAAGLPVQEIRSISMGLYITEDGGRTWRALTVPQPAASRGPLEPATIPRTGDPAILFDGDGRLHLTALIDTAHVDSLLFGGVPDYKTYYLRTDNRGRTWTQPVILDPAGGFQDRNWIVRDPVTGTVYVSWQNLASGPLAERHTQLVWSTDNGTTWNRLDHEQWPTCSRGGHTTVFQGRLLLACEFTPAQGETRLRVYSFAPAEGAPRIVSELPVHLELPALVAFPDGRIVLSADTCFWARPNCTLDTLLFESRDAGRTWSAPRSLRSLTGAAASDWVRAFWTEADAWGRLHVLTWVATPDGPGVPQDPVQAQLRTYTLSHTVLGEDARVLQNVPLDRWADRDHVAGWALLDHRTGGDFFGLSWSPQRAVVAWTVDGVLRTALSEPIS